MLASIIVPTYNRLGYLRETIDSVLAQTRRDIELIIVDDESQEDVEGLVRSYNDERIRFFRVKHTGCPGININTVLGDARGDVVMTIGSDDRLLPRCVEKLTAKMEGNPEAVMAHSDLWIIDGEGNRTKAASEILADSEAYKEKRGHILHGLFKGNIMPGTTTMMRRDLLLKFGGFTTDPRYQGGEDYEMMVRFAAAGFIEFVDEPLGEFRIHSAEQLSASVKVLFTTLNLVKKWQAEYTDDVSRGILLRREADLYKSINSFHLRNGDEKAAARAWWDYCRVARKPWMFPALAPRILRWRRLRRISRESGRKF